MKNFNLRNENDPINVTCIALFFFLQKFNVQQILLSFEILPLFTQQRSALLRFKHTNSSNNSYFAFFQGEGNMTRGYSQTQHF